MDEAQLSYRLVRSRRRTLTMTVTDAGELVVKAPLLLSKQIIDRFVSDRRAWAEKRLTEIAARPTYRLTEGEQLPFRGGTVTVRIAGSAKTGKLAKTVLTLPDAPLSTRKTALERCLREEARKVFAERIAYFAPIMHVTPGRLTVSGAATRWGSCGAGGSINLNWRLILGQPEWLDYVVVHELGHLVYRDHSKHFWAVVGRTLPDYARLRKELNSHRLELMIECTACE